MRPNTNVVSRAMENIGGRGGNSVEHAIVPGFPKLPKNGSQQSSQAASRMPNGEGMSHIERVDETSQPSLRQESAAMAHTKRRCLQVSTSPHATQWGDGAQPLWCRLPRVLRRLESARRQKILILDGTMAPQQVMAEPSRVPTGAVAAYAAREENWE